MRENRELPLSPAQQRLWFLEQLAPGGTQYNVFQAYELSGPLDADALRRALGALADRHDALRMTFPAEAGSPAVRLDEPPITFHLERTDLTKPHTPQAQAQDVADTPETQDAADGADAAEQSADAAEQSLAELASQWSQRPYDLARDRLMRAHLVRLSPDRHILMLGFHHIIIDGWSAPIIDEELSVLYAAEAAGHRAELPPLKSGYADYARWQNEKLRSPEAERHLAYWRERLSGAPPLATLPADRPRPPVQRFRGADFSVRLPDDVAASIGDLARANRATPFMVALTAFTVLLARYARADDVVVGVVEAGRSRPEFASTVGFFVQTLPIRLDLSGDPSFLDALAGTREALFGAYEHDLLSFDMLVDHLRLERDLSYTPLVQVIFQLLYLPPLGSTTRWHDLDVTRWGEGVTQKSTRFDLELHLMEDGSEGFGLEVCYNVDLFDHDTVRGVVDDYVSLLRAVCGAPGRSVSELTARVAGPQGRTRVSIRDDDGVPLPRGALGRLWLDDAGIDTGHLARIRPDGTVEHHGPYESELRVRGCRVAARVIEDVLSSVPEVASARVRNDPSGSGLAAKLVPAPRSPEQALPSDAEMRRRLRKLLPAFLIPTSYEWERNDFEQARDRADDFGQARERADDGQQAPEPVVIVVTQDEFRDDCS
ncbi:condensation domain-containing protein [Actinomadura fulvescens]|uniref:Condensation domain-containing protein n=1 Tax=Actinomadura fulvescens TaxID=46160 RepID=A0ABP6CDZ2_9ACTN